MKRPYYQLVSIIEHQMLDSSWGRKYIFRLLEEMNARCERDLGAQGESFRIEILISPSPRDLGECAKNGYDKLRPRTATEIKLLAFYADDEVFLPPAHYLRPTAN